MLTKAIIFACILALFLIWLYYRNRIRYWVELFNERGFKSTIHYDRCLKIFLRLYQDVNAMRISLDERKKLELHGDVTYTYGEVTFYSFVRILEKADPKPGEVFYDLGSGGGKAVFIAGLVFDFSKACGIEKLDALYTLSTDLLVNLNAMPEVKDLHPDKKITIQFLKGDFLQEDFSDGDIIFVNAACFLGKIFDELIGKLLKLKVGSRIILGSAKLDKVGGFELIYTNLHLMSWGLSNISIYKRV